MLVELPEHGMLVATTILSEVLEMAVSQQVRDDAQVRMVEGSGKLSHESEKWAEGV